MFWVENYLTSGQRAKEGTLTHPLAGCLGIQANTKLSRYPGNIFLYPNNNYHWSSTIMLGLYWMYLYRFLWRIPAVFGEILPRTSVIGVFSPMADARRGRSSSMRLCVGDQHVAHNCIVIQRVWPAARPGAYSLTIANGGVPLRKRET